MDAKQSEDPKVLFSHDEIMATEETANTADKRSSVRLSVRAEQVASQYAQNAVSPFVLATTLRVVEFFAVMIVGLAAYFSYVVPQDGIKPFFTGLFGGDFVRDRAAGSGFLSSHPFAQDH